MHLSITTPMLPALSIPSCPTLCSGRCGGGIARMKTLVDRERRADPSLLLLNAGDDFIGTVWDHKYGSKAAAHFQSRLQPDAMVSQLPGNGAAPLGRMTTAVGKHCQTHTVYVPGISQRAMLAANESIIQAIQVGMAQVCMHCLQVVGNHEFDWGSDSLAHYLQSLSYPALGACNLGFKGHWLAGQVTAWTTKAVKGRKVGCNSGVRPQQGTCSQSATSWCH